MLQRPCVVKLLKVACLCSCCRLLCPGARLLHRLPVLLVHHWLRGKASCINMFCSCTAQPKCDACRLQLIIAQRIPVPGSTATFFGMPCADRRPCGPAAVLLDCWPHPDSCQQKGGRGAPGLCGPLCSGNHPVHAGQCMHYPLSCVIAHSHQHHV